MQKYARHVSMKLYATYAKICTPQCPHFADIMIDSDITVTVQGSTIRSKRLRFRLKWVFNHIKFVYLLL